MNALLVSPRCVETMWSLEHILHFNGVRANIPPLGLLTVAAMLPQEWELKVVDMDVTALPDADLAWADLVLITGMGAHAGSLLETGRRAKAAGKITVGGGPYMSAARLDVPNFDHVLVGEAENVLPAFLEDLANGGAKPLYDSSEFPSLDHTPIPRWDLIDCSQYLTMPIQTTRGCPHGCEFCHVMALNGRVPRHKPVDQVIAELDAIFATGHRWGVFFSDDNFVGNRKRAKTLLHALIAWQEAHGYPFYHFITQASIDMVDDDELLALMGTAGFQLIFVGIESPSPEALKECRKKQNQNRDLADAIRRLRAHGMDVMAGFIVGFDTDTQDIFEQQLAFIEEVPITLPMINILIAPPDTPLWRRLEAEGRLLADGDTSGRNLDENALNFNPVMGRDTLMDGYRRLAAEVYAPEATYRRIPKALSQLKLQTRNRNAGRPKGQLRMLLSLRRILWTLGVRSPARLAFWRFFVHTARHSPGKLPFGIMLAVMAHHNTMVTANYLRRVRHRSRLAS